MRRAQCLDNEFPAVLDEMPGIFWLCGSSSEASDRKLEVPIAEFLNAYSCSWDGKHYHWLSEFGYRPNITVSVALPTGPLGLRLVIDDRNEENPRRLIFTALHETFITYLKLAFFVSLFLGSPIFLTQMWKFIAPGLYKNEKKALLPYLVATPILFLLGGMLVYYLVMPLAIKFFLSFETSGQINNLPIQLEAKVNEYLSLIMRLIFAFGISFQLPVLLNLLARVGAIDSKYLKERRRYFIVIIFAAAAILTPPDPITQIGLAIPLLILYELSILSVKLTEKKNNA